MVTQYIPFLSTLLLLLLPTLTALLGGFACIEAAALEPEDDLMFAAAEAIVVDVVVAVEVGVDVGGVVHSRLLLMAVVALNL